LSAGLSASVDLADGHVDVAADDLSLPARGPALAEGHVWDSTLAQAGAAGSAGQGWQTSLMPSMGGGLTSTVSYTDATGALWLFPYTGALTATAPYTTYQTPAGLPWALTTSTARYTLTNALTSETLAFDAQGRYLSDTDAYGNQNVLSYGASGPISDTNSGGRALSLFYSNGLLSDVQSPLWRSSAGAQGQHVTYGYNGSGQLTTLTRGAGTTDTLTTTFGYSGTQLIRVTTPYTQAARTWTLSYDDAGRLASPVSGTLGQAGYTPAYTTLISYNGGTSQVVDGAGTSGTLTTTYIQDGVGEATAVQDGLGQTRQSTFNADLPGNLAPSAAGGEHGRTPHHRAAAASVRRAALAPCAAGLRTPASQPACHPRLRRQRGDGRTVRCGLQPDRTCAALPGCAIRSRAPWPGVLCPPVPPIGDTAGARRLPARPGRAAHACPRHQGVLRSGRHKALILLSSTGRILGMSLVGGP
jgi:hypothetical protein